MLGLLHMALLNEPLGCKEASRKRPGSQALKIPGAAWEQALSSDYRCLYMRLRKVKKKKKEKTTDV